MCVYMYTQAATIWPEHLVLLATGWVQSSWSAPNKNMHLSQILELALWRKSCC